MLTLTLAERTTGDGVIHSNWCIEMAIQAIADNNGATEILEPGRALTDETAAEAIEWIDNGNSYCGQSCGE